VFTLLPPTLQDRPACSASHPAPKAVFTLTLNKAFSGKMFLHSIALALNIVYYKHNITYGQGKSLSAPANLWHYNFSGFLPTNHCSRREDSGILKKTASNCRRIVKIMINK